MGDRVGLFIMWGMVVILVIGVALVAPRRRSRAGDDTETMNKHVDRTVQERAADHEGASRHHLIGNPPLDTVTTEGWGVAQPGEGQLEELPLDAPESPRKP